MPDRTGPMEVVRCYVGAFNKGDVKEMAALFDESGSILDGLAPHVWQGPTACRDWYREATEAGEREGAADYCIALGEPSHVDVTGDNGYVVVPATMKFKVHGREATQTGATYVVALRRRAANWRIRAWAWEKGAQAGDARA